MNKVFKDGLWSKEINVSDFVHTNITPYEGDASFLAGPTERTKKVWNECLKALEEERANNGVRSLDNVTVSTINSHKEMCIRDSFRPESRSRIPHAGILPDTIKEKQRSLCKLCQSKRTGR